jgi:hypothetical protein
MSERHPGASAKAARPLPPCLYGHKEGERLQLVAQKGQIPSPAHVSFAFTTPAELLFCVQALARLGGVREVGLPDGRVLPALSVTAEDARAAFALVSTPPKEAA